MSVKITCITKDNGNHENPYVAITSLGWINEETKNTGVSTREAVYIWVKEGGYGYVKDADGNVAELIAETSAKGTNFVKTVPDDVKSDNLLKLPECK